MTYDALGRRVVEKEGSIERLFYYDGAHIIEETDSSLNLTRLSLFGIELDENLYSGDTDGSGNLTDHHWPLSLRLYGAAADLDHWPLRLPDAGLRARVRQLPPAGLNRDLGRRGQLGGCVRVCRQ